MSGLLTLVRHLTICHKRYLIQAKGGRGSGGWGHAGRLGKHGGSKTGSGGLKKIGAWRGSSLSERRELAKKKKPAPTKKDSKKRPVVTKPIKNGLTTDELLKKVQQGEIPLKAAQEMARKKLGLADKSPEVGDVQGSRKYTRKDFTNGEDTKPWDKWNSSLSDNERTALQYYAAENVEMDLFDTNKPTTYKEMNAYLRGRDTDPTDITKKTIEDVNAALNKGSVSEDTTAFRGLPERLVADLKPGDTFTDKGFVSTSLDSAMAESFTGGTNTLAEVRVPKGSKGGYMGSALTADYLDSEGLEPERELLLPSGTEFRIVSKEPLVMEVVN